MSLDEFIRAARRAEIVPLSLLTRDLLARDNEANLLARDNEANLLARDLLCHDYGISKRFIHKQISK